MFIRKIFWGSIEQVEDYLVGIKEEKFHQDNEKQDAVLHRLEIIGEAVKHFSDKIRDDQGTLAKKSVMRDFFQRDL